MNKTELVAAIAERTELTKKDADQALKAFIDVVGDELSKGEKIQLAGFGTFEVTESTQEQKRLSTSQLLKLLSSKL
jgi:DNA-binding protein HU-beta